jgi:hypothetical protein
MGHRPDIGGLSCHRSGRLCNASPHTPSFISIEFNKAEVVTALSQDLWKHLRWQLNKRSNQYVKKVIDAKNQMVENFKSAQDR